MGFSEYCSCIDERSRLVAKVVGTARGEVRQRVAHENLVGKNVKGQNICAPGAFFRHGDDGSAGNDIRVHITENGPAPGGQSLPVPLRAGDIVGGVTLPRVCRHDSAVDDGVGIDDAVPHDFPDLSEVVLKPGCRFLPGCISFQLIQMFCAHDQEKVIQGKRVLFLSGQRGHDGRSGVVGVHEQSFPQKHDAQAGGDDEEHGGKDVEAHIGGGGPGRAERLWHVVRPWLSR